MPPKAKLTKEQIIRKAYEIVREHGALQLTARTLAQELACSTQPIYQYFKDMKQLQSEVAQQAARVMEDMIKSEAKEDQPQIISVVSGYIRFAMEEKNLYHLMFSLGYFANPLSVHSESLDNSSNLSLVCIAEPSGLLSDTLQDPAAYDLYIYAHGIVMMNAFGSLPLSEAQVRERIIHAYDLFRSNKD